jgi:DNA/RNA endonuclease G (NUC1)
LEVRIMTYSTRRTAPKWTASKLTGKSTVKLSKDYLYAQHQAYDKAARELTVSDREYE